MSQSSSRPFAVVTGASSGIGYELARQFAEHGFDLLIAAEHERIAAAEQSLRALGGFVESVRADLATYEGVEKLYERIQSTGRLRTPSRSTPALAWAEISPARTWKRN